MINYHNAVEAAAAALKGGDVQTRFEFDSEWSSITVYQFNSYEKVAGKITWKADTKELSIWEHQDPSRRRTGDLNKILDALRMDLQKAS